MIMKNELKLNGLVSNACVNSYHRLLAQIAKTKKAIQAQFRDLVADHEQLLRLALNEAEALAWQTRYPQLVFADLAQEKAQGVVNWIARQQAVRSQTLGEVMS